MILSLSMLRGVRKQQITEGCVRIPGEDLPDISNQR